ncbi:MAG TPA: hypothetical protein VGP07_16070 [Polyangia bacterium]|jgi:hypothetical protein
MKRIVFLVGAGIPLLAAGCGTQRYGFRPATIASSSELGFPASHYVVPPEAPKGEAFVTSFGTREIEQGAGGAQLIHVRLAVANQASDKPWSIDPGKLLLNTGKGAPQRPDFMEIDGRQNGSTEIARGERKVLDLYFRMPGGAPDARAVPSFDLAWQVDIGDRVFTEHTPFMREPYQDYENASQSAVAVGVAPPWWIGWYGPPYWGPYGPWAYGYWPYYGYGPRVGVGIGVRGYYGAGYHGSAGGFGGGHSRVGPTMRGRH